MVIVACRRLLLFYDPGYYFAHPLEILKVWEGGMAFHGGLIGAAIGVALFAWREKVPLLTMFDLASLVAPIGLFFGRIANFIRPELWGQPIGVPWAMIFPGSDGVPRHPSQLYEAGLEGVALFAVLSAGTRAPRPGCTIEPRIGPGWFSLWRYTVARTCLPRFYTATPKIRTTGRSRRRTDHGHAAVERRWR